VKGERLKSKDKKQHMNRADFLKKLARYMLLLLMAIVVLALGNKIVTAKDCSGCPGNGVCKGNTDCNKY